MVTSWMTVQGNVGGSVRRGPQTFRKVAPLTVRRAYSEEWAGTMTAPPENLADRPANPTPDHQPDNAPVHQPDTLPEQPDNPPDDLLSELLRSVRLSGERIVAH